MGILLELGSMKGSNALLYFGAFAVSSVTAIVLYAIWKVVRPVPVGDDDILYSFFNAAVFYLGPAYLVLISSTEIPVYDWIKLTVTNAAIYCLVGAVAYCAMFSGRWSTQLFYAIVIVPFAGWVYFLDGGIVPAVPGSWYARALMLVVLVGTARSALAIARR
jgi:hypothetical protein